MNSVDTTLYVFTALTLW